MVETQRFTCGDIHSIASVETQSTYEENLSFYEEHNYSYVPLPIEMKYYDVEMGTLKEIDHSQIVDVDTELFEGLESLSEYPFLLTRDRPSYWYQVENGQLKMVGMDKGMNVRDLVNEYPNFLEKAVEKDEGKRWGIVTPADANKRASRAAIYLLYVALEQRFAKQIVDYFPDSKDLLDEVDEETADRWRKARENGLEVHLSEYMLLWEMKEIIRNTDDLREGWGFESKNQFDDHFGGPVSMRNKIMHPVRRLFNTKKEFEKMVDRIDRIRSALNGKIRD